jgi:hypothetical protein
MRYGVDFSFLAKRNTALQSTLVTVFTRHGPRAFDLLLPTCQASRFAFVREALLVNE